MVTKSELTRVADNIRILSAAMVEKAKSGHPGGAMGGADFMAVLYTEFLRYDPDQMDYPFRDRFFLDPGHMSPMLYSTLALAGTYTVEDLRNLRQWGSVTPGHPEVDVLHGVENTSGPLGQGHAMALGAAIAETGGEAMPIQVDVRERRSVQAMITASKLCLSRYSLRKAAHSTMRRFTLMPTSASRACRASPRATSAASGASSLAAGGTSTSWRVSDST